MRTKARKAAEYLISPVLLLLAWELLMRLGIGDRRFVPTPSDVLSQFIGALWDGELARHTAVTLYRVLTGYILGVIPGIIVGLLMAMFRPVQIFFEPLIAAIFPIPKVALMPLMLLVFGFGDTSKIVLVASGVFFPVCLNTFSGAANMEKIYWDVGKNYGASQYVMFTRVVLPGALPTTFAGLRIGLSVAFLVLIASEFVSTDSGLGYLIWNSWELLDVDLMFAGIVMIGFLGVASALLFDAFQALAIPWRQAR